MQTTLICDVWRLEVVLAGGGLNCELAMIKLEGDL